MELISTDPFNELADLVRFRPLNMARSSAVFTIHPGLMEARLPAGQAIRFLIDGLGNFPQQAELFPEERASDLAGKLREIVPRQQGIAPLQFNVVNGKLALAKQKANPDAEDEANVLSANSELVAQGNKIIESLVGSNCDRRLVEAVISIQDNLISGSDVIALGLKNIACELMRGKFEAELPNALSAMLMAQTTSISMYVAQFPEWQRFAEKAASANISPEDAPRVAQAVSDVVREIEANPHLADPEVPRTLKALRALIDDPANATKRSVYAVWRSVENLVISVFNYGADLIGQTAKKASGKLSGAASTAIVIALMTTALAGASTLAPLASKIPESAWLSKAVKLVREQMK